MTWSAGGLGAAIITLLTLAAPNVATAAEVCARYKAGSEVSPPPELFSKNGVLHVALNYWTTVDDVGRTLFCYQTPDGLESPTLHVQPGDTIQIDLTNMVPPVGGMSETVGRSSKVCGSKTMTPSSINMHFHGLNISPKCHSDETIRTLVNSGQTFTYKLKIPANEPPGLYWYHPHVHEFASPAVQGGATGVIVVDGIENIQPAVAGLPQRVLVLRDEPLRNSIGYVGPAPFWDVSVNYVPVPYPNYPQPIIKMTQGTKEFWRVANAGANTILDLEVDYDGQPQTLEVVGLDGVPTGSQDGTRQGKLVPKKHILLPPAARVEFILTAPTSADTKAFLITRNIEGGPASDVNPRRSMAQIVTSGAATRLPRLPKTTQPPRKQRFEDAANLKPDVKRKLYFWETQFPAGKRSKKPVEPPKFFIVTEGKDAHVYSPDDPPDIIAKKGTIEDWTIENHSLEVHDFHIHQVHFLVLEVNGKKVPAGEHQWRDTYQVPYWTGDGPYPSIKVRMDFRGAVAGDFVYHCHILDHEDRGMMAIIRVLPKG
ncbi:MAG: multicopper oxidase domain-containing protein [Alphaproteobacteria bacterium]|nr:multicopper oxidase domain-containing protein [Alphaproteobacteria bacterium]